MNRWLRALDIAGVMFWAEGYSTAYLDELKEVIQKMALRQIGALWRKNGKRGNFLSGTLDLGVLGKVNIAVFQTEKGEGDEKKPDATIHIFEEK